VLVKGMLVKQLFVRTRMLLMNLEVEGKFARCLFYWMVNSYLY